MADRQHQRMLSDLSAAFDAGRCAVVVTIARSDAGDLGLTMRSTPISVGMLHATAQFVLEQTIARAEALTDGSAAAELPHLVDALRSLEAAIGFITAALACAGKGN